MTEPNQSGGGPDMAAAPICPWCSAPLRTGREESCPSCGAALHEAADGEVPGVTRVDHEAILKARTPSQRGRGLIGWLSGEYSAEAPPPSLEGIAPPDEAVRREMIRLELAALQAEAQARQAEAAAEAVDEQRIRAGEHGDGREESLDDVADARLATADTRESDAVAAPDGSEGNPATTAG
jgi:hypothetical protein